MPQSSPSCSCIYAVVVFGTPQTLLHILDSGQVRAIDPAAPGLKLSEINWTPLQFLASPTNSVKTVLEPAGFENAQGIITTQFTKQAGDPAWANDSEVKEYVEFMKKWVPNDNPGDFVALSGYIIAQGIVQIAADVSSIAKTIGVSSSVISDPPNAY